MSNTPPEDAWKPDGWESWSQTRRTLWRRERQAFLMERLEVGVEMAADRDLWVEHLRTEAAELRQQLESEEGPEASA